MCEYSPLSSPSHQALEFLAVLLSSRNSWVDEQFINTGNFHFVFLISYCFLICFLVHFFIGFLFYSSFLTGIFEICVQLFFTYHWNNFLHSCVSDIIMPFLEEREIRVVFEVLFSRCKLGERIIQADRENTEEVSKKKKKERREAENERTRQDDGAK